MNDIVIDDPLLVADNLSAGYGKIEVLHGVSIVVHRGEMVSIIGANGAGKSTLLNTLAGVHRALSGSIRLGSEIITECKAPHRVSQGLILVPEGRKIFPKLTVLENLQMGAYLRADKQAVEDDLSRVLRLFPILKERCKQAGGTLSGGEQQMLAIGRALMSKPTVLLMDEPSMGVAPMLVERIFETVKELHREGLTILLVEQNASLALKISKRAYVLELGRIRCEDSTANLLEDPRVQEAYLGA